MLSFACPSTVLLLHQALFFLWAVGWVSGSTGLNSLKEKPYDTSADWESTVVAKGPGGCTFAKKPTYKPLPECPPPTVPINSTTARSLGWKFAPILYQHPLDNSWLTDPPHWLDLAAAYDMVGWERLPNNSIQVPPGVEENGAEDEYLSAQKWFATRLTVPTYNAADRTVAFDTADGTTVLQRAVVDPVVNGRLTGKVHYTVFRPYNEETGLAVPHAYVYTYMLYYPFNGCSNMALATQVDGKKQGVEFFMCGDGAHEGDLEHVKVLVCEADMLNTDPSSAIRRAQYSQHGWLPDFDCAAGECAFEADEAGTRRLVVLAGLHSHSNWKAETPLFVYAKVRLNFLLNMDGLYIGDRYKKGPVFYPNQNNTLYLPYRQQMSQEQKKGRLAWANFPGVWGATLGWTGGRTITCFRDNFTRLAPCDARNPATYILDVMTQPKGADPASITWTTQGSGNTVTGPLWERAFAYSWQRERAAPIYTNSRMNDDQLCPLEAPLRNTVSSAGGFGRISLKQYLGAVTGLVLASAVVACAMILPALLVGGDRAVIREVEEEEEAKQAALKAKNQDVPAASPPAAGAGSIAAEGKPAAAAAAAVIEPPPLMPAMVSARAGAGVSDGAGKDASVGVPAAALLSPSPAAAAAEGGKSGSGPSRLSVLLMSHGVILRAFHASVMQPWFLVAWIFIGVGLYVCGVVLGALGIYDSVVALNSVVPLSLWDIFHSAIVAVFVVFGVLHLAIIVTSIWVRPSRSQLCACGPEATQRRLRCLNGSWGAHAVLVGLLVVEMNVSMLMFALGLMLWVARYIMAEACVAAVKAVFKEINFLDDVCLDLSSIGLPDKVCGTALTDLCSIWGDLKVDYLSFGSMCFIIAQAMFLVLATTNYVATRTGYAIQTVMQLTQKTEAERAGRSGGGRTGSGGISSLLGRIPANALRSRSKGDPAEAGGEAEGGSKKGKLAAAAAAVKKPRAGADPDRV